MSNIAPLPGFREFPPQSCSLRNFIFQQWRKQAKTFNFQEYDLPILEPLELFTEKSGPEIASQLFNFTDKGNRNVALRPEMTPGLARLVASKANSLPKPIKWFSIGEQFRYERPQKGRLRSFYQLNCDIFAEPSPIADAEIISLLVHTFTSFGFSHHDFFIRLSDRLLWNHFLHTFHVPLNLHSNFLQIVDKLERDSHDSLSQQFDNLLPGQGLSLLSHCLSFIKLSSLQDIQSFFTSHGPISEELSSRLADWNQLLSFLNAFQVSPFIKIDLSIVRGLAYYSGFVFEAFQLTGKARALAGGGRYDFLIEKFGGPHLPAVGFGLGDVTLSDFLSDTQKLPPLLDFPTYFLAVSHDSLYHHALAHAATLRSNGLRTELPYKTNNLSKLLKQADASGASFAILYTEQDFSQGLLKIKNLKDRSESTLPIHSLLQSLLP